MTNEEQALEVSYKITGSRELDIHPILSKDVYKLILAFAGEIRADAAEKAWDYIELKAKHPKFGMELSKRDLRLAVTGKDIL